MKLAYRPEYKVWLGSDNNICLARLNYEVTSDKYGHTIERAYKWKAVTPYLTGKWSSAKAACNYARHLSPSAIVYNLTELHTAAELAMVK